ncbi:hypothetical protein [Vibrio bivalvicida]|uniref:Glycosyltransferase RgtA/B/C/D-like domain-containing protein n=1 Tax=Vibrio bivalvicida TaxID=1276888 RepID=A0ABV4MP32_9VIBR
MSLENKNISFVYLLLAYFGSFLSLGYIFGTYSSLKLSIFSFLLMYVAHREQLHYDCKSDLNSIVISLLLVFISIALLATFPNGFLPYFNAFPYESLEMGGKLHHDTLFHVALIKSIMNFGYTSIGQDDNVYIHYHYLSHYFDAGLSLILSLDPFEDYALLMSMKMILLVMSVQLFLIRTVKGWALLIALSLILSSAILYTWHIVGSHSLFYPSLFFILFSSKIFSVLVKEECWSNADYLVITFVGFALILAKVSSGFVFLSFVGVYSLATNIRNMKIYFWGSIWLVLIFIQWYMFRTFDSSAPSNLNSSFDVSVVFSKAYSYLMVHNPFKAILSPMDFIFGKEMFFSKTQTLIYCMLLFLLSFSILSRKRLMLRLSVSFFFVSMFIFTLSVLPFGLNVTDIFYFNSSLIFIMLVVLTQAVFYYFDEYSFFDRAILLLGVSIVSITSIFLLERVGGSKSIDDLFIFKNKSSAAETVQLKVLNESLVSYFEEK